MKPCPGFAVLAALTAAFAAHATTLVALDLPALTQASDAIVQGRVTRAEARLSKDGRRVTIHYTLEVAESLKGPGAHTVEIVQQGGAVGDIGQYVSGNANLKEGDELVAFLEQRGGRYLLTGMAQGCFHVERSTDGKAAFAVPEPEGDALLVDPATHAPVSKAPAPLKLDDLKSKIRSMLAPGVVEQPGVVAPPTAPAPTGTTGKTTR